MSEVIAKIRKDETSAVFFEEKSKEDITGYSSGIGSAAIEAGVPYSLQANVFKERPHLLSGASYFPLDDDTAGYPTVVAFDSGDLRTLTAITSDNIAYDENGAWVGTAVTNLWPIKTNAMGWTGGTVEFVSSLICPDSYRQTLTQASAITSQTTLTSGNSFASSINYYTISSYYRQFKGSIFSNPDKFILVNSLSGTEISKTDSVSYITPMRSVYQKGWATANYLASSSTAFPYIRWITPTGSEYQSYFTGEMVEQNYFVSPWCKDSRGQGELTYNLNASAGLQWNNDYTIMYWKKAHGTDNRSKTSGYNAESIGSSTSGRHLWFGRNQADSKYGINGISSTVVNNYQYQWFFHVLRRVGTNFILQVFSHTSKIPVVNITIDNSAVNTPNYYVTPQGYDFRLGGRDVGYANNSYYKELQVMNYALSDSEVSTYFNTKYKALEDHIPAGFMTEGVL